MNISNDFKKWTGSILLLPVAAFLLINNGRFIPILDHVNLLFHEGGHGVFKFFGKFIYTLGGSLMQIIIPSLFIFYFLKTRRFFALQLSILYLAENLLNISVYAGDAVARKLPLLGGNKVYHDWNYLLAELGILQYDQSVKLFFFILALVAIIVALLVPFFQREY